MTRSSDLVMVEREVLERAHEALSRCYDVNDWPADGTTRQDAALRLLTSALQSVEGGVQGSIATKQESCPESAPRTETALEYGSIEDRIADATRDAAESHKEDCNSYGAGYDSGYLAALIELRDDQLTKTPSADHDAGNLRGLSAPNHQHHAGSQAASLAEELERLCCAETEGKFFDCVTDNIQTIITALRRP